MKLCLVLVACLGVSLAAPKIHPRIQKLHSTKHISQRDLFQDILDIVDIIPLDQVLHIFDTHLIDDPAVCSAIGYLRGDAWKGLVAEVGAIQATIDFIAYLNAKGVPVDLIVGGITGVIDAAVPGVPGDSTASINPFLDELVAVLPLSDLLALLNEKLQTSMDFQDLYNYVATEGKALVDQVLVMPEVVHIRETVAGMGLDLTGILTTVYDFFGWGSPPSALKISQRDLLQDFLDFEGLLPLEEIVRVLEEHLTTDPAVDSVIIYLQGDVWKALIAEIATLQGTVDIVAFLDSRGVPIELLFGAITGIIDAAVPGVEGDNTASLRGFLDHLKSILPLNELLALLNDKMLNSTDFQELYAFIATPEGKAAVDLVLTMPEVVRIRAVLTGQEADVAGVLLAIYDFFAWGQPPK